MKLDILNKEGKNTGRSVELPDSIFQIEPNDHVIYLAVKQYLAANHQGTHKVKTRAEVHGASRKLHRQKGTGGSRKGNIRNPLYKGGGTVFGPKPHGYAFKLNKKVKDLAKTSALAYKAKESAIKVIEELKYEAAKTASVTDLLNNLEINYYKILMVVAEPNENLYLSCRNIPYVKLICLADINTYDILNSDYLILSEDAAKIFSATEEILAN